MSDKTIYEFDRNKMEKIKILTSEYMGTNLYHFRTFVKGVYGGREEYLPTQKGITLTERQLSDFFLGVDKLKSFIKNGGEEEQIVVYPTDPLALFDGNL